MFNSTNDCFISSPSSPSNLIFNRPPHHNSRYHPYNRVSASYYPTNELETYSFDNNNNNNNSSIQNYDHSITSYDYNMELVLPFMHISLVCFVMEINNMWITYIIGLLILSKNHHNLIW